MSASKVPGHAPSGRVLRFGYPPVRIDVRAEDAEVVLWLAEFLAPSFEISEPDETPPDHLVAFVADVGRCERLAIRRDEASRTLDGFTYDGSFSRNRAWDDERDGSLWVADQDRDIFFHIQDDTRRIEVVASSAAEPSTRVRLLRVVRELATAGMARVGGLPVHGAAISVEGAVVLICGPKRAGKTSLLVHALECGASFVANDRVFVGQGDFVEARGMPTIVMLRRGTLDHFGDLAEAFESARYDYAFRIAACAPGLERPDPRARYDDKEPGISPIQLCSLLGAPMIAGGPVRAVLFPRIDASARGLSLAPASPEASLDAMKGSLIKPSHPARSSQVFAPLADPTPPEVEEARCRSLLARVPAFDCRLGPDAFEHDLLETLVGATRTVAARAAPRSVAVPRHGLEPRGAPLLARAGLEPVRSELVHERSSHSGRRAVYRIHVEGGGCVKLRLQERRARAETSSAVRRQVKDGAFSRLLDAEGAVVLEEWIDGTLLDADDHDPARIREAARLLARLHDTPVRPAGVQPPEDGFEASLLFLESLSSGGLLTEATASRFQQRLRRTRPTRPRVGAVHGDFCAENMLIDTHGKLRVFDNEGFTVGALGYDLGRTWCRWPLPPDRWRLFLDTYDAATSHEASAGERSEEGLAYWKIVAAIQSAYVRSAWKDGLDAALARLARLAS